MPIDNKCLASWNSTTVAVTARVIPRYAWTSASIDVAVGEKTILKTGGVLKMVGTHVETFELRGATHTIEVTWGKATFRSFPFSLSIDGLPVLASSVPVANWWFSLWPLAFLAGFFAWRALA